MSKSFKQNYLSKDNGCFVIQTSSQTKGTSASNILNDNPRALWVTDKKMPQYCIIDTSSMKNYPRMFNRVSFYCWHEYQTNPSLVEIAYCNNPDDGWTVAGKIRLALTSQKQYFKIKDIPTTEMKQLKIVFLQTFGNEQTYLNQIELGYMKQGNVVDGSRQKTFSEYIKLTSTEKQLKKTQDQLKMMALEHDQLKNTIKQQSEIILKMQQSLKKLTKNMQKMHEIQQIQNKKIVLLQKTHSKQKIKQKQKQKSKYASKQISYEEQQDSQEDIQNKYIQNTLMSEKTLAFLNNNPNYSKSQKQSHQKQNNLLSRDSKKMSKGQNLLKSGQLNNGTESDLSEFNASEDERNMMVRLQSLLAQRVHICIKQQRRHKQLQKKKKSPINDK